MSLLAEQRAASPTGSIGISFGTGGFGVSASSARGKEAGDDLTQANTKITAGNRVNVQSGGDTSLQGALVKAETSTYDSKQSSVSASVTIGMGGNGSFNASKSKVNSDFAGLQGSSGCELTTTRAT